MTVINPMSSEAGTTLSPVRVFFDQVRTASEYVIIPLLALAVTCILFSGLLLILGQSPVDFFELLWRGGFGTPFSWQNTLTRSSPLILTALCVAIPAQLGLVIIGGEGALVLGTTSWGNSVRLGAAVAHHLARARRGAAQASTAAARPFRVGEDSGTA